MRILLALSLFITALRAPALAQDAVASTLAPEWSAFVEPKFRTRLDMPSGLFSIPDGPSYRGVGQTFITADGRAVLAIYSMTNEGDTPHTFLNKVLNIPRSALDYERVTRAFFAISAIHDGTPPPEGIEVERASGPRPKASSSSPASSGRPPSEEPPDVITRPGPRATRQRAQ